MKTTSHNYIPGNRLEKEVTHTKRNRRHINDPAQTELVGIIWQPLRLPFRLRAGDVIRSGGRLCRVIRVNECSAVVIMNRPVREFTTRFDKPVRFQPTPTMFHISSNSDVEILNRKTA